MSTSKIQKFRNYTLLKLDNYELFKTDSKYNKTDIENHVYTTSLKNYEKMNENENDEDILIQIYLHYYMKLFNLLETNNKNLDLNLSREEINPEKWLNLTNKRSQENSKASNRKKGIHRCPKCKSWYTDYQQLQTASADESMRVSVVCIDCNWHWKYS